MTRRWMRLARRAGAATALLLLLGGADAPPPEAWIVPDIDALPHDVWGETVRHGRDLVAQTYALIGPEVADPAKRYAGSNMACQNCHLGAGTRKYGVPYVGVFAGYPSYRIRSGRVGTLADRVNGCMTRSLNGKPLPPDGPEMTAISAYIKFLSTGREIGAPTEGRGVGRMAELSRPADPVRGKQVFTQVCAACHGAEGQGQRNGTAGDARGYAVPPLWGPDSFNDGAGMNRLITAANFVHNNMPNGTTWEAPSLPAEDAWDVAAYVDSQPRPHRPGLEKDFPNRLEKLVDAPFGPYADTFPETQHKYGPFAPIRAAINTLRQAEQTARAKATAPGNGAAQPKP